MSYEGREYFICEAGHVTEYDAWSVHGITAICHALGAPMCKAALEWQFSVDDTNCLGIEPRTIMVKDAKTCTCQCGHTHVTEEATFRPDLNQKGWVKLTT